MTTAQKQPQWQQLIESVETIEELLFRPELAQLAEKQGLKVQTLQAAIRGLKYYLARDKDAAAHNFEVLAEDLRDDTLDVR